eukprot:2824908-Rhodomonas_salina.2
MCIRDRCGTPPRASSPRNASATATRDSSVRVSTVQAADTFEDTFKLNVSAAALHLCQRPTSRTPNPHRRPSDPA